MKLETHRHQCEIRDLCAKADKRGMDWLRGHVAGWKRWDGLRDEFWRQWRAGNRGDAGDWRDSAQRRIPLPRLHDRP